VCVCVRVCECVSEERLIRNNKNVQPEEILRRFGKEGVDGKEGDGEDNGEKEAFFLRK